MTHLSATFFMALAFAFGALHSHESAAANPFQQKPKIFYDATQIRVQMQRDFLGNLSCTFAYQKLDLFTGNGENECRRLREKLEEARRQGIRIAFTGVSGQLPGLGAPEVVLEDTLPARDDKRIEELLTQLNSCENRVQKLRRELDVLRPSPNRTRH